MKLKMMMMVWMVFKLMMKVMDLTRKCELILRMGMKLTALDFKSWLNRQRISGRMMRMMTTVMMKNCNHPLMKWTLSFSLWIQSKNLTQTLDSHYQALADGVAQHAEQSRVEIEKERMEKEAATVAY